MPAARKPRPRAGSIDQKFAQWATLRYQADQIAERQKQLRDELDAAVQAGGLTDEKGSYYLNLHTPFTIGDKTYRTMKSERRVSERLDEDAAEELLREKGLLERAQKTVVVFDPDELYVLNQEGLLSDEELDSLIIITESFAFKPQVTEMVVDE